MTTNIYWFRNDLRLADHCGLAAALGASEHTALIFVLDEQPAGKWAMGGASRWWLHHALQSLGADIAKLGGKLLLRRGDAGKIIPELAAELKATEVHAGVAIEPWARRQDQEIETRLKSAGIDFHLHRTRLLFAPDAIKTKTGGAYGVYTPFSRACLAIGPPQDLIPAPSHLGGIAQAHSEKLDDWKLLPTASDWAGGLRKAWVPGEAGAAERLQNFLQQSLSDYAKARNLPAQDGTSGLSPHLHFGEISPSRIWHAASSAEKSGSGLETYLREILWREFNAQLLWHHPDMPDQPLRPEFAKFPWVEDKAGLTAWQRGQTGIPIVDAGMRQLWQTGWMHNRIRMVCASFLIKHQLIAWQDGEAWFWDTLVDADLGNNGNNWQWVAGCGADAAPYFRIFNPVLQGRKFDPEGAYVRLFVPELKALPDKFIHAPWEADEAILAAAKVTLGRDYPNPIVDLAQGRARALAAYDKISKDG